MRIHIIFVSVACVSMVCVTTPVEASPKEARHTSMQTRAFCNDSISSLSCKRIIHTIQTFNLMPSIVVAVLAQAIVTYCIPLYITVGLSSVLLWRLCKMTSSSVEAIPDGRECSYFASGQCKRANKCKFRHVERDSEGKIKKEWPTRWQQHVVATMDPEEMSRTWVSRTSLGQLMPMFVETHGAPGRILQSRRAGQRTHFTLNTSVPNSIVQSLASSTSISSQQVYFFS